MATKKQARKQVEPSVSRPQFRGYGIPESSKGLLTWRWAQQRLEKSHNYIISTVRPDGSPHTMVIWGLWMDGAFLFSTGQQSRKARNLATNPRCTLTTDNIAEAVIVEGEASLLSDSSMKRAFAQKYQRKYKWDMSDFKEPLYQVRPRVAFGLYEKKFQDSATRWTFPS
jgi:nitroimidazol reductase NimA-like FMN-containing flavoprotein (pyridoxamine 5'-phosphate oxidase superfamily)